MADYALTSNRRTALSSFAAIGAAATMPAVALAQTMTNRATWDAAIAELDRKRAAWERASAALEQARKSYLTAKPKIPNGVAFLPGETTASFNARVIAMDGERERADAAAKASLRVDELGDAESEAMDRYIAALNAVMACRAPDMAAVSFKLQLAIDEAMEVYDLEPLLTDLRLLGDA